MGLDLNYTSGQTPLDEDEKEGLLIPTLVTRGELDEFEQQNIEDAIFWILGKSLKDERIFSEEFVRTLHKKMYGDIWKWAGTFRKSNKNFGVDKWQISTELKKLCDDAKFWLSHETFTPEELSIRFKHRIVSIHCFPNGNGRHSRLMADIIISKIYKQPMFTWGSGNLISAGYVRSRYLAALRNADLGDFTPLVEFART